MKMNSLSAEARAKRLNAVVDPGRIISLRAYNLILTAAVLYGVAINAILCRESIVRFVFDRVNPITFFIIYFVMVIAGVIIAHRSENPLVSFLGYNMIVVPVGLVVAEAVVLGGYSPSVVWHAFITTAGVTVIMVAAGALFPQFFEKLGSILFFGLIGVLFGFLISIFLPGVNRAVTILCAGLFSLYIGYDVYRSQQFPHTVDNAIDSAIDIYLDVINLFLNLLRIFGNAKDS
jgi:FtsH-binding integral membrane protein